MKCLQKEAKYCYKKRGILLNHLRKNSKNSKSDTYAQLWIIVPVTGKQYKVINKASSLAITSNGKGPLTLEKFADLNRQLWACNELLSADYNDDEVANFFQRNGKSEISMAFGQPKSILRTYITHW